MTTDEEAWDAVDRPDSYPQLAVVAGVIVIAGTGFLLANLLPYDPLAILLWLALGGIALAAVLWGIAWLVTLRHATIVWQTGALGAFLATAAAVFFFWSSAATAAATIDVELLRRLRVDIAGTPVFPGDSKPGPVSQLGLAYIRDVLAERKQRDAEVGKLIRIEGMTRPQSLTAQPELLNDCGRFTRGKTGVVASDQRLFARAAQFRQALAGAIGDSGVRAKALTSFDKGWGASRAAIAEMSRLRLEQLDQMVGMCQLLAQRHWRTLGYFFEFTSGADVADFNRRGRALNELTHAQERVRLDAINRINARLEIAGDTRF